MSEYQYYDFLAIEKSLTREQQKELRNITSRADISSKRLTNEYHFGSFKGDPLVLVEKYFDLFLYYSNFGVYQVIFKVPFHRDLMEKLAPFEPFFKIKSTGTHLLIDICPDWEDDWPEIFEDWEVTLLVPIRESLMEGRMDALYIPWLSLLAWMIHEDPESLEPCPSTDLSPLNRSLKKYAEFFTVSTSVLQHAYATVTSQSKPLEISESSLRKWLKSIPAKEREGILLELLTGNPTKIATTLKDRYRAETSPKPDNNLETQPRRPVYQLIPPAV